MTQKSFHWNGASIGDADALVVNATDGIGYRLANVNYQSLWVDLGHRMLYNGDENRGPLNNWQNELAVAAGAGMSVDVATGGAVVCGMPYENTAIVNVAIPAPTTDTRYDRIVLRRDWAAQTIRITRIPGTEGGAIPSLTQSPAPSGTGIYDIPLATVEVTTVPAIGAITDDREFCRFGGVPGTGAIGTTQITNSSIDWADRATETKRVFLGGGCLEPALNASQFQYSLTPSYVTMTAAPTWDGAGNLEGWQLTGATYIGAYIRWTLPPPDYASGDIQSYVWWVPNAGVASTYYIRSVGQIQCEEDKATATFISYSSVYINETTVANQLRRTAGIVIPEATYYADEFNYGDRQALGYMAYWYNSAGVEDINILGVEFVYTGYV